MVLTVGWMLSVPVLKSLTNWLNWMSSSDFLIAFSFRHPNTPNVTAGMSRSIETTIITIVKFLTLFVNLRIVPSNGGWDNVDTGMSSFVCGSPEAGQAQPSASRQDDNTLSKSERSYHSSIVKGMVYDF